MWTHGGCASTLASTPTAFSLIFRKSLDASGRTVDARPLGRPHLRRDFKNTGRQWTHGGRASPGASSPYACLKTNWTPVDAWWTRVYWGVHPYGMKFLVCKTVQKRLFFNLFRDINIYRHKYSIYMHAYVKIHAYIKLKHKFLHRN